MPKKIVFVLPLLLVSLFFIETRGDEENKSVNPVEGAPTATRELFVNVLDCGAKGDGVTDDSEAIQRAFDKACRIESWTRRSSDTYASRTVILPAGNYRIVKTLTLDARHSNIVIRGTGFRRNTNLVWDGADGGTLLETWACNGLMLEKLAFDGTGKAGTLFRVNSIDTRTTTEQPNNAENAEYLKKFGQRSSAEYRLDLIQFKNAGVGMSCGDASYICASDMTLIDVGFADCATGFVTYSEQNLNYNFIRPEIGRCDIGMHFAKGGNVTATMLSGHSCGYAVKIGKQGINVGTYNFIGMRVEARIYKGKRTAMLYAEGGEVMVKISSMILSAQGISGQESDLETPMFTLKDGAQVFIDSSLLAGCSAKLESSAASTPSWIQFDNCRFRIASDPRTRIAHDEFSGFNLRNCVIVEDKTEADRRKGSQTVFVEDYRKSPQQAVKNAD